VPRRLELYCVARVGGLLGGDVLECPLLVAGVHEVRVYQLEDLVNHEAVQAEELVVLVEELAEHASPAEQHLDEAPAHAFVLHVVVADGGLERALQAEGGVGRGVCGAEGHHVQDPGHLAHDHVLRKVKHVTSGAKGLNVPWGAGGLDWSGFRVGPGAWGGNHAKGKSLGTGCA